MSEETKDAKHPLNSNYNSYFTAPIMGRISAEERMSNSLFIIITKLENLENALNEIKNKLEKEKNE